MSFGQNKKLLEESRKHCSSCFSGIYPFCVPFGPSPVPATPGNQRVDLVVSSFADLEDAWGLRAVEHP